MHHVRMYGVRVYEPSICAEGPAHPQINRLFTQRIWTRLATVRSATAHRNGTGAGGPIAENLTQGRIGGAMG